MIRKKRIRLLPKISDNTNLRNDNKVRGKNWKTEAASFENWHIQLHTGESWELKNMGCST